MIKKITVGAIKFVTREKSGMYVLAKPDFCWGKIKGHVRKVREMYN